MNGHRHVWKETRRVTKTRGHGKNKRTILYVFYKCQTPGCSKPDAMDIIHESEERLMPTTKCLLCGKKNARSNEICKKSPRKKGLHIIVETKK